MARRARHRDRSRRPDHARGPRWSGRRPRPHPGGALHVRCGLRCGTHPHRCSNHPPSRPRARVRPECCGVRADRDPHHRVRHARVVAGRGAQHRDRQPGPPRWRDVPHAGCRRTHRRSNTGRARVQHRTLALTCVGPPGDQGRDARGRARRGDRDSRPRSGPRAGDERRQPGAFVPEQLAIGRCAGPAGVHGLDRHLPERDDPPRGRVPAVALRRGQAALRSGVLRPVGAQHRQLQPAAAPGGRSERARDGRTRDRRTPGADRRRHGRGRGPVDAVLDDVLHTRGTGRARCRHRVRSTGPPAPRRGHARPDAGERSVRGSGHRPPEGLAPRHRPWSATTPPAGDAADRVGTRRDGSGRDPRGRAAPGGDARRRSGRPSVAGGTSAPAVQQLVDAQRRGAREGPTTLHTADAPGRRSEPRRERGW